MKNQLARLLVLVSLVALLVGFTNSGIGSLTPTDADQEGYTFDEDTGLGASGILNNDANDVLRGFVKVRGAGDCTPLKITEITITVTGHRSAGNVEVTLTVLGADGKPLTLPITGKEGCIPPVRPPVTPGCGGAAAIASSTGR